MKNHPHPTRHNKSKCFELAGGVQDSHFQISISSNFEFKEFAQNEAKKKNISTSKLFRDSLQYVINNNIKLWGNTNG